MVTEFTKPAIGPIEQIDLLKQRGLTIHSPEKAVDFLRAVSFFRLTPYMRPFQINTQDHKFKDDTGFKQLSRLYDFDRRLRLLVMDALERIEVAIRAHISNHMGVIHGAHWYLDEQCFKYQYQHKRLLKTIEDKQIKAQQDYDRDCKRIEKSQKSSEKQRTTLKEKRQKESYARHYAVVYDKPKLMPNWAMLEELTFGDLSHLYKGIKTDSDKKNIAKGLGLPMPILESWLHTLTVIRNICAHHSRLWNRELGIKPVVPKQNTINWPKYLMIDSHHTRVSVILAMLQYFMIQVAPHSNWQQRLFELFDDFPDIHIESMGLPQNWQEDIFWE